VEVGRREGWRKAIRAFLTAVQGITFGKAGFVATGGEPRPDVADGRNDFEATGFPAWMRGVCTAADRYVAVGRAASYWFRGDGTAGPEALRYLLPSVFSPMEKGTFVPSAGTANILASPDVSNFTVVASAPRHASRSGFGGRRVVE